MNVDFSSSRREAEEYMERRDARWYKEVEDTCMEPKYTTPRDVEENSKRSEVDVD